MALNLKQERVGKLNLCPKPQTQTRLFLKFNFEVILPKKSKLTLPGLRLVNTSLGFGQLADLGGYRKKLL